MPRRFVDDREGDVADKEVDDGGFGYDIFAADADGIDVLLLNVGQHHATTVTDDLCRGIDVKGVGCIPESLLHVRSERLFAGGEMDEEDMDVFMQAVQNAFWEMKKKNKEKYTPKKYKK